MKLGLDFHGVCDSFRVFSELSNILVSSGSEVHVITGEKDSPEFRAKLDAIGLKYTHLFSILSHHESLGTNMWKDDRGNLFMDKQIWDVTKAEYCEKNKIDLHIDDSDDYGKWFRTPYLFLTRERSYEPN